MARPPRRPSIRPSMVDAGWEEVPSLVPLDTVVGGSTESNELTAPIPRERESATEISEHTLSEPTGDIDELLAEPSSSLGLPSFASPPSSRPPPPSHRPPPPSHRPPPPSHRPPPPSQRPPPPARTRPYPPPATPPDASSYATAPLAPMSAFAPTQPMPERVPPPPPERVAPPRARMPSDMPVQVMRYDQAAGGLRREDSVLSQLGLDRSSEVPPSSASPSSRLPAGIVIPDSTVPAGGLFAPSPASAQRPSADATQPASRARSAPQSTTVPSPIVPDMVAVEPPEPLVRALTARVKFGANVAPLWAPIAAAAAVLVVLFSALFLVIGLVSGGDDPAPAPAASGAPTGQGEVAPEPESTPPGAVPPKVARTLTERAAQGDEKALFELSGRPPTERTIAESLAIASGHAELHKRELAVLAKEAREPGFANDTSNIKKLLEFLQSADTARSSLEILARVPSVVGPDVLYQVWTGTPKKNATSELAEALVLSKEVRARASPALAVALDLRSATTCEQTRQVLTRAAKDADRRSLYLIGKLSRKTGCGERKRDDCYPCLRDGDEIKNALKQARKQAAPRY